ncbi:DUF1593 domain-containing protein [Trichoderma sp. SZMC 28013]
MADTTILFPSKPRIFILTDITNEPDDAESFCRYLTYANQFHTEGIVAVTSVWLRNKVAPENVHEIIDAYEKVVDNLNAHVHPESLYPSAEYIRSIVRSGPPVYGMAAVSDDIPLSDGAQLLLERLLANDSDPLWVLIWGGSNVLAQALHYIRHRDDAEQLRAKLRVYAISDQDDTGAWMRRLWPDIFYICSVHGWNQYSQATWTGISGDTPGEKGGPDTSKITKEWIKEHIQVGPLGAAYPDYMYIVEGDTPTFLYMIQNGLGLPEQPSYGSWGGRYLPVDLTFPRGHFGDAADEVIGKNGQTYISNWATIWRWRNAFQDDFAARMQWTLTNDFTKANHHPIISINGNRGLGPLYVEADAGSSLVFDASETFDPDGDTLSFKWFQYREPSATRTYHTWEVPNMEIKVLDSAGKKVEITVPKPNASGPGATPVPLRGEYLHLILEVQDSGSPPLTSYRRILITPLNKE